MIPKPLRTLATGTAVVLGGIFALNLVSSATIGALRLATEAKRVKALNFSNYFATCVAYSSRFCGRGRSRCPVRAVEEKDFTYADYAKGMPP